MKRVAILGSDSSHTEVYTGLTRTAEFRDRVIIASIWGENVAVTEEKARSLGIPLVAGSVDEALRDVDGVFVLSRFTEGRAGLARRAVAAGLPVFVDKSISEDPDEARAVLDLASAAHVPIISCSPYRFSAPVVRGRDLVAGGGYPFGSIVGPAECRDLGVDERFRRLDFYGVHSVDAVIEVFGDDVRSIRCEASARGFFALVGFGTGAFCALALLSDLPREYYRLTLAGSAGIEDIEFTFDADDLYRRSLSAVLDQLFVGRDVVEARSSLAAARLIAAMQRAA